MSSCPFQSHSKANLPKPWFSESVSGFPPPKSSPARAGSIFCGDLRRWRVLAPPLRLLAEKIAFQEALKKVSNFDAISTSILERLGSVLEGQDGSQINQKSIKIEFPSLSVSASFFISIFDRFSLPTSSHWISKKYVLPIGKQCFLQRNAFRR